MRRYPAGRMMWGRGPKVCPRGAPYIPLPRVEHNPTPPDLAEASGVRLPPPAQRPVHSVDRLPPQISQPGWAGKQRAADAQLDEYWAIGAG